MVWSDSGFSPHRGGGLFVGAVAGPTLEFFPIPRGDFFVGVVEVVEAEEFDEVAAEFALREDFFDVVGVENFFVGVEEEFTLRANVCA